MGLHSVALRKDNRICGFYVEVTASIEGDDKKIAKFSSPSFANEEERGKALGLIGNILLYGGLEKQELPV